MSDYTVKTLGQLVRAQPKEKDYEAIADTIAGFVYNKLVQGKFTLSRSAKYDNSSQYGDQNGSFISIELNQSDEGWAEVYPALLKRFIFNNLNHVKLSAMTIERIKALDEEKEHYLDDVSIISAYASENEHVGVKDLSAISMLSSGAELRVNLAFKLADEDGEDFLAEYNNGGEGGLIFGKVKKFYYLGGEDD